MKNDPWIGALVGVLALCALVFLGLDYLFVMYSREARQTQPQVASINARRTLAMALVNEVGEYSKQHPDILAYTGLQAAKPGPAPAPAPATKPK